MTTVPTPSSTYTVPPELEAITEARTIKFISDLSEEQYNVCHKILSNITITKKTANKFHWPKFKKEFCDTFQSEIEQNLTEILYCTSITLDSINPKRLARLLKIYMNKYFDSKVLVRLEANLIGYQYFIHADAKLSQMTSLEAYNLYYKIHSMITNSVDINELDEFTDLISIYSYYQPGQTNIAHTMFLQVIPKNIIASFLDKYNLDANLETIFAMKLGELHQIYVDYIENRQLPKEVNYIDKGNKKNKSRCNKCHRFHNGKKCTTNKKQNANANADHITHTALGVISDDDDYMNHDANLNSQGFCGMILARPVDKPKEYINNVENISNEEFILDTGATVHITNNKQLLSNIRKCPMEINTIMGTQEYDTIGDIKFNENFTLKNVLYMKDSPRNIISLTILNKQGFSSTQNNCICTIKKEDQIICNVEMRNNLYILDISKINDYKKDVYVVLGNNNKSARTFKDYGNSPDAILDEILEDDYISNELDPSAFNNQKPKWYEQHMKYGHASKNQLLGLGNTVKEKVSDVCFDCAGLVDKHLGKTNHEENSVGELLHVDLIGPIYNQYALVCIDNKTKYISCYIMNNKSEATQCTCDIVKILNTILNKQNKSIIRIRADNEFRTIAMINFCSSNGISLEFTAPHSSFQNGTAENANKQIKIKLKLLMKQSGISKSLWTYALLHAIYVLNHLPRNTNVESPWSQLYGKQKDISTMVPFGCLMFYHNHDNDQKIFTDYKSGIFLGYDQTNKIAFILDVQNKKIIRSSAFKAIENVFPMRKLNWFDSHQSINDGRTINREFPTSSHPGIGEGNLVRISFDSSHIKSSSSTSIEDSERTTTTISDADSSRNDLAETAKQNDKKVMENEQLLINNDKELSPNNTSSNDQIQDSESQNFQDQNLTLSNIDPPLSKINQSTPLNTQTPLIPLQQPQIQLPASTSNDHDNLSLVFLQHQERNHERALDKFETLMKNQNNLMINQNQQTNQMLQLCNTMIQATQTVQENSLRPANVPHESGLLNLGQQQQLSLKNQQQQQQKLLIENQQQQQQLTITNPNQPTPPPQFPLLESSMEPDRIQEQPLIEPQPEQLLLKSSSEMDETNQLALSRHESPEVLEFNLGESTSTEKEALSNHLLKESTTSSSKQPVDLFQLGLDAAHKYAMNPAHKRYTHADTPEETLMLVSKQKKTIRQGPSFSTTATNPDGSVILINSATSKVSRHTNNASRNKIPIQQRSSLYQQNIPGVNQIENTQNLVGLNGNKVITESADPTTNEIHLLVNKAKYIIPETYGAAMKTPQAKDWKTALFDEIKSIQENKVYTSIDVSKVPKGALVVKSRLVFTVKQEENPTTKIKYDRFKVRLVAKGFTQVIGINYLDIYSPVMRYDSLRLVLTLAGIKKWKIKQLDAKNAFLNGELDVPIYLKPPTGVVKSSSTIWKLNRSLYGLKQSPRIWYETLTNELTNNGFKVSIYEPCLLWKHNCMILIYVDDILITGDTDQAIKAAAQLLKNKFVMKEMGEPKMFLGMNLERSKEGNYTLSLCNTIERMAKDSNATLTSRTVRTPVSEGYNKEVLDHKILNFEEHKTFRKYVGQFGFLANTGRPDIAFTVSYLSRFLETPSHYHLKAAIRTMNYLVQTKNFKLTFGKDQERLQYKDFRLVDKTNEPTIIDYPPLKRFKLTTVTDADWAGDHADRRSQCGAFVMLNGNLITWFSRKEANTAISSAESEYIGMFEATKETIGIRNLLQELGINTAYANLVGDNQSALTLGAHGTNSRKTKHIDIKYHFVREIYIIKNNYV